MNLDFDEQSEDDSDDFLKWFIQYIWEETAIVNGDFQIVFEDEIIFGLDYVGALDRAKEAIAAAGYTVWDRLENNWVVEFFVEDDPENDLVLFATIEPQQSA